MNRSTFTRRGALGAGLAGLAAPGTAASPRLALIEAPSNLGLRPPRPGHEPGAWRAPEALTGAGLFGARPLARRVRLPRPRYSFDGEPGTRVRNGHALRAFSLQLADAVAESLRAGEFPVVLGGDCGILLGVLLGARRAGGRGLVHVDGHSDFFHPGNYDTAARLGTAAGMDLALATGRGEPLLTRWPGVDGPLVADADAIQVGERDAFSPDWKTTYGDIERTAIARFIVQDILKTGVERTADQVVARLAARGLDRAWLHVDLDVLDEKVMPAVDSPGSPGFTHEQLAGLMRRLLASGRFIGADATIYDPDLDPDGRHARRLAVTLEAAFAEVG